MTLPTTYVDWYCKNCGHEHETNQPFYSYPVTCPSCGEKSIRRGPPVLATNMVYCDSEPQQYSVSSDDKQIQVYMRSLTGKSCGVTLDPENGDKVSATPMGVMPGENTKQGAKKRDKIYTKELGAKMNPRTGKTIGTMRG